MTAAEINSQPERVRRYIHDLEARCDPSGDIQEVWALTDNQAYLVDQLQRCRRFNRTLISGLAALLLIAALGLIGWAAS